jgi:DNA-binding CsgD family transcriptional regulator
MFKEEIAFRRASLEGAHCSGLQGRTRLRIPMQACFPSTPIHRLAAPAHEASARLFASSSAHERELLLLLTPRELECLRWTMGGKTAWEVARILGISEQTAARHLSRAIRKLDCVNKHQAVLKALRLGLIP